MIRLPAPDRTPLSVADPSPAKVILPGKEMLLEMVALVPLKMNAGAIDAPLSWYPEASKTRLWMTKSLPRSCTGESRPLAPKITSVVGEDAGTAFPNQLPGLLQLLLLGNGKPLDAPVQVAAKAAPEIRTTAAKAAAVKICFSMKASEKAGTNVDVVGMSETKTPQSRPMRPVREHSKNALEDQLKCSGAKNGQSP